MSKNKSLGKIFGISLCIVSVVIFIGIFIFSSDIRGYKKLLDKYYLSIQRGTASDFAACYADGKNMKLEDVRMSLLDNKNTDVDKDFFENITVKYKINDSEKQASSIDEYKLTLAVTMSVDDESYKTTQKLTVGKSDGKWKIIE